MCVQAFMRTERFEQPLCHSSYVSQVEDPGFRV